MKSIDQRLHEWRGKCWHEGNVRYEIIGKYGLTTEIFTCAHCKQEFKHASPRNPSYFAAHCKQEFKHASPRNPSYSTQIEPYWELLQELRKHEKWDRFLWDIYAHSNIYTGKEVCDVLLDQKACCVAICEFFCKEDK